MKAEMDRMILVKVKAPTREEIFPRLQSLKEEGFSLLGDVYFSGHAWKAVMGRGRQRRARRNG